ncbi:hypothetical protein EZV62_015352 [Acer yangbiense]|uniref:Senescence-associated protein n=1 Tax=Acer yangbiense TaxID=1000413 RepID=A0A5C7HKF8_9ROSI|nr:hypothetical protein EZV62_015352 [Acer yangbiense]
MLELGLHWFSWYTRELEPLEFNNLNLYILKSGLVDYKATLPLTIPRRVFKSSAKDSTRRSVGITFQGGPCGSSAARASQTARASGDREVPTAGLQMGGGRTRRSSPDSDLEAFSHNPAHGSFAPLVFHPSAMTNCANQRSKGLIGHAFMVRIRTENQNQTSFYPFVPHEISVLVELILGHLRYLLTDVPPQPNSPPDNVFCPDWPEKMGLRSKKRGSAPLPIHGIIGLESSSTGSSFPTDSAKPVPLAVVSLDSRQGHRIPLVRTSSESTVRRPRKAPEGAVPSPSPCRHAVTRSRRGSSSSSPPTADGFGTETPICTDGRSARARALGFTATAEPFYSSGPGTCPDGRVSAQLGTVTQLPVHLALPVLLTKNGPLGALDSVARHNKAAAPSYLFKSDERFARQYRCGPPPEFPLASPRSGIVHHLSGPDRHALTRTLLRRSRLVGGATREGSRQSASLRLMGLLAR